MTSAKVAVIGLGGTIAMRSEGRGAVPALTTEDLVQLLPASAAGLIGHVENFLQVPGAHIDLDDLPALAVRIAELERSGEQGFVVLQGTDTIEETVFALDLLHGGDAPVFVTGAMRHAGQVSADGAANLGNSIHAAAATRSTGRGAMVCFNDELHAAWAVQKTSATNPAAFSSPGFGPMGHVIEGRARYLCETRRWSIPEVDVASIRPAKVAIVAASQGEGPDLVEAVAERDYAGLVVQATGAGHLHHSWVEPLEELSRSIPVVLATRVSRGPVLSETYAFKGSESDLLSRGLISAGFLCASKARILLSLAMGAGFDANRVGAMLGSEV